MNAQRATQSIAGFFVLLSVSLAAYYNGVDLAHPTWLWFTIFVGLNLAAYYYSFLLVLLLAHLREPRVLALMFIVEAVSYTLLLFEDRQVVIYFYRNLLTLYLLAAVFLERAKVQAESNRLDSSSPS